MSFIRIDGNQFEIKSHANVGGGIEIRPYFMRTSFCLLAHYQKGELTKARDWLDRIKAQGFDGPRLFGENQYWFNNDNPLFFGHPKYTSRVRAFDGSGGGGASSKTKLVNNYYDIVDQLAIDLFDRDMIAEFCCIATVKGWDPSYTSHGLNRFAQMFAELLPDPRQTPFLHEAINEYGAHSSYVRKLGEKAAYKEFARFGSRWRRGEPGNPSHHNYPGSTIGMSGGEVAGYDDLSMTHRNLHPRRGDNWDQGPDGIGAAALARSVKKIAANRPVAFNETCHYMTREQWDEWTPKTHWAGISSVDAPRFIKYYADVLGAGVSVCVHDLNGMSTDPSLPLSVLEKKLESLTGTETGPDPEPDKFAAISVAAYRNAVERAYNEVLMRAPDHKGWEAWCEAMHRGSSEARVRESMLRSPEFKRKFLADA